MRNKIAIPLLLLATCHYAIAEEVEPIENTKNFTYVVNLNTAFRASKLPLIGFNDLKLVDESDETLFDLHILFETRFQYKRFFLETIAETFNDVVVGYSFYDNDSGNLDFIITNSLGEVERNEVPGFEQIEDREGDVNVGFRHSRYFGNTVLQTELVGNPTNVHEGFIGAVRVGRQKQLGNWDLTGYVGTRYFSDRVLDHFFSVSENEASADLPVYEAEGGFLTTVQVGANLPWTEKLVFNVGAAYSLLPESVSDSPLAQGDSMQEVTVGFTYLIGDR